MGWNSPSCGGASSCISNALRRRAPAAICVSLGSLLLCKGGANGPPMDREGGWGAAMSLANEHPLGMELRTKFSIGEFSWILICSYGTNYSTATASPLSIAPCRCVILKRLKALKGHLFLFPSSWKTLDSCIFTLELGRRRRKGRKHQSKVPEAHFHHVIFCLMESKTALIDCELLCTIKFCRALCVILF